MNISQFQSVLSILMLKDKVLAILHKVSMVW